MLPADLDAAHVAIGLGLLMQLLAAFDDITHHVVEKLEDVEQIGIAPLEFLDEMAYGETHRLAAGLLDADLHLPPPLRELVHQLVQALAVLLDQLADAGLLLVGLLRNPRTPSFPRP
ncbi:MAG: hypothetical protein M5R42_04395 [Rhodocyclaceae bacterium]|nr:hypothetical protein [Rhodocyclaceae bacterium]